MLAIFIQQIKSNCDKTFVHDMGVYHTSSQIESTQTFCINVSYYPFYIMFDEFPDGLELHEYYSRSPNRETNRDQVFTSSNITAFRVFDLPYGYMTLKATKPTQFAFTYISLPGYCQTGVYLSTFKNDQVYLSQSGHKFYNLGNYDDKCFIFGTDSTQRFKVEQVSSDKLDRIFFHRSYRDYSVAAGNITESWEVEPSATRPFLRLLTNRGKPPSSLKIKYEAAQKPVLQTSGQYTPRGRTIDCEHIPTWYSEELIIMLIACCIFFAIIFILLVSCRIHSKRNQP